MGVPIDMEMVTFWPIISTLDKFSLNISGRTATESSMWWHKWRGSRSYQPKGELSSGGFVNLINVCWTETRKNHNKHKLVELKLNQCMIMIGEEKLFIVDTGLPSWSESFLFTRHFNWLFLSWPGSLFGLCFVLQSQNHAFCPTQWAGMASKTRNICWVSSLTIGACY